MRQVGSEVAVGGRKAVCIWDGRPEHHFARVRWEDSRVVESTGHAEMNPTFFLGQLLWGPLSKPL